MSCSKNYYNNAQEIINDLRDVPVEFATNSSNTSPTTLIINEPLVNPTQVIEKRRWVIKNPQGTKREKNKLLKKSCLAYINTKGKQMPAKSPRNVNCDNCRYKCTEVFPADRRQDICKQYHSLSYDRQKDFIINTVATSECRRKRTRDSSRPAKNVSKIYTFVKNGEKKRVCKNFYLKTLSISHGPVDSAIMNIDTNGINHSIQDRRGKSFPGNKTKPVILNEVKRHIESFPVMESHYCRRGTTRKYLDSTLSILKMYELYKDLQISNQKDFVSPITYRRVFCTQYNLSFFKPKKDQCLLCVKEAKSIEKSEEFLSHIKRRDDANRAKDLDKQRAIHDKTFVSVSFDLQSVLQIPCSDVSPLYYSRKLCAYNLAIYEAAPPNKGYCYLWSEVDGQRGSCEIGTALLKWFKTLPDTVKEVSLFSDTCGGQNRNKYIAALLLFVVNQLPIEIITHNFLEKGHSHMEADSMHSAIESAKKYIPVFCLNDWKTIMTLARSKRGKNKTSGAYIVEQMTYRDIIDLKALNTSILQNTIRDEGGEKIEWLKIKQLRYEKEKKKFIMFRYNYDEEYKMFNIKGKAKGRPSNNIPKETELKKCYTEPLPISIKKKNDLIQLCRKGVIPIEYHERQVSRTLTQ
nr:uncharacterized protein LOC111416199 [Onthophagus taurus]XP_022910560.1 uncharacterized protein LOC111421623 [Onthophagus taurus]